MGETRLAPDPPGLDVLDELHDSIYPDTGISSSVVADTFGAWVEISADIGAGRVLQGVWLRIPGSLADTFAWEAEIGEGAVAAEAVVDRVNGTGTGGGYVIFIPLHRTLTDNARISARIRDEEAVVNGMTISLLVS